MRRQPSIHFISAPHRLGLLAAALIFFVVGVIYGLGQIYVMFSAVVALPVASYLVGWWTLRGLRVRRSMPAEAAEGETVPVKLTVANPGRFGRFLFRLEDRLPEWLASGRPGGVVQRLMGGEQETLAYSLRPTRRGVYQVGPVALTTTDPAGLFRFGRHAGEAAELVVYPAPVPVPEVRVGGDPTVGGREPTRRPAQDGTDFHSVREYMPGDDLRRIHWKSTARLGVFNVLEFEQSLSGGVTVVLDLDPAGDLGEGRRNTLEYAVKLAAGVVQQALMRGVVCRFVAQGEQDRSVRAVRGRADIATVMDALARVQADGPRPVSEVAAAATERLRPGATVVVITAVPDPALPAVVGGLKRRGARVTVVLLRGDSFARDAPSQPLYESAVRSLVRTGADVHQVYAFDGRFEAGRER